MRQDVSMKIAALSRMTMTELKVRYAEAFGEKCRSENKAYLLRRTAWRIQADAEGGLSERAKKRALEIANDSDLRLQAPKRLRGSSGGPSRIVPINLGSDSRLPMPGAVLTRAYKGQSIQVTVLEDGFEWQGATYRTLSAVAKAVTGSHWNGFQFFGLNKKGGNSESKAG